MPHMKSWIVVLAMIVSLGFLPETSAASKPPRLEVIKNGSQDCGCGIFRSKDKFLVVIGPLEKDSAIIATGGKKHRLKWVSSNRPDERPTNGARYKEVYEGETLKLTLDYRTLQACGGPEPDKCAIANYSVKSTLEEGSKKTTVSGLKAVCGC